MFVDVIHECLLLLVVGGCTTMFITHFKYPFKLVASRCLILFAFGFLFVWYSPFPPLCRMRSLSNFEGGFQVPLKYYCSSFFLLFVHESFFNKGFHVFSCLFLFLWLFVNCVFVYLGLLDGSYFCFCF